MKNIITVEEYMKMLRKMVKENPEVKKYPIVSSSDDEGNSFNFVLFSPTVGKYIAYSYGDGEFFSAGDDGLEEALEDFKGKNVEILDVVCVN